MDLIADGLLIATALTAALYCLVLSRRLRRLTDAQSGVGAQIGELSKALEETRSAVSEARRTLSESRASARNAQDALAREVATARAVIAELQGEHARARRREAAHWIGDLEAEARPPTPEELGADGGHGAAPPAPQGPEDAADPADEDAIPDWPDGVVALEPDEAPAAAPQDDAPVAGPDVPGAGAGGGGRSPSAEARREAPGRPDEDPARPAPGAGLLRVERMAL